MRVCSNADALGNWIPLSFHQYVDINCGMFSLRHRRSKSWVHRMFDVADKSTSRDFPVGRISSSNIKQSYRTGNPLCKERYERFHWLLFVILVYAFVLF